MKPVILAAGAVFLLFAALAFFAPDAIAQSPLDQATFCNEGMKKPCPDIGICKDRMRTCEAGRWSAECTGGTGPSSEGEICDNGLDDNCNGLVDECVSLTGSIGIFLIVGGVILLIFALILSRIIK